MASFHRQNELLDYEQRKWVAGSCTLEERGEGAAHKDIIWGDEKALTRWR